MKSREKLDEFLKTLAAAKGELLREEEPLLRQRAYFQDARERATMLEAPLDVEKAEEGLRIIDRKLTEVRAQLGDIETRPQALAMAVFNEGSGMLANLKKDLEAQKDRVDQARAGFLEELHRLAAIKERGEEVSRDTARAGPLVRLNPLNGLKITGQHRWAVDLDEINRILKA